jgi:hypothetical protein
VLFPKSSTEIIDNWQVIGLRGTGSDSYMAMYLGSLNRAGIIIGEMGGALRSWERKVR